MIVEFIGSTGAGKTTLASEVQRRLANQTQVATSFDLAAAPLGLRRVTHPTVRNLIQDVIALPFFFGALYRQRAFVTLTLKILARESRLSLQKANYLRSIVRKIGMHDLIRRHDHDQIVLVDEGTLLSAYLLFVYTRNTYSHQELERFARLVPLPDLAVYVKAPTDSLVQRSLRRSDARQELRSKDRKVVEEYVGRAVEMFDQLTQAERIRNRVLVVANPASTEVERGTTAERIARFILDYEPADEGVSTIAAGQIEPGSMIGEIGVS